MVTEFIVFAGGVCFGALLVGQLNKFWNQTVVAQLSRAEVALRNASRALYDYARVYDDGDAETDARLAADVAAETMEVRHDYERSVGSR